MINVQKKQFFLCVRKNKYNKNTSSFWIYLSP